MLTSSAAGVTPVAECTYSFGVTDVNSFLATASILEGVGVSAYLGAAADIMSKTYLTAAGSILTVEARHSSYLRAALKESPFPQPFDAPLTLDEVYSLASQFIVSCPSSNPALPVKAFPLLSLAPTTAMPVAVGNTVTLLTPVSTWERKRFLTQMIKIQSADNASIGIYSQASRRCGSDICGLYCRNGPYICSCYPGRRRLLRHDSQRIRWSNLRRSYWLQRDRV